MHPYRVSIAFLGSSWGALDVEVSDPETEPDGHLPLKIDDELVRFGGAFGFGDLQPVRVVGLEYQIAQKLHAVTDPTCVRAHDLVDLQLLWEAGPDPALVRSLCVRTFGWRRRQPWPPLPLRAMDGWGSAYEDARAETEVGGRTAVVPTVDAARTWLTRILEEVAGCGDIDG